MNSKILVCAHKHGEFLHNDVYVPIHAGHANNNIELVFLRDDIGDNISVKNSNYCELTALYWAWKNMKDVDIIGLCHYRRFFNFANLGLLRKDMIYTSSWDKANVSSIDLAKILSHKDIILPKPLVGPYSLKHQYCLQHIREDLDILRATILDFYPDYISDYDHIMNDTNKLFPYNMFITRWDIFDDYCKWLFGILFLVEKKISISKYPYQARVFGFMGERLLNLYCYHHGLKVEYRQVCMINTDAARLNYFQYWLRKMYFNFLFFLISRK